VTIQNVVAIVDQKHWKIRHLDIKMTFLHENLQEEVYLTQLKGFVVPTWMKIKCVNLERHYMASSKH